MTTIALQSNDIGSSQQITVSATNAAGTSAPASAGAALRALAPEIPAAPTDITLSPSDTQLQVTWTAPTMSG